MNIKSLLIGSAAALVAVTGARAADAVMAPEPEPVEYVRVCDAYGNGFFYIPGTETCLQISGYVWYQMGAGSYEAGDTPSYHYGTGLQDGWRKSVRARLNIDARSETEWGTLRSYIRLQADWSGTGAYSGLGTNDGPVGIDQAYITLGGFMVGYSESFWVDSKNGGASNYGSHSWSGMYYGYQERALIGYRFDSNGFFGAISLEDDNMTGDGFVPDVVAKLGYTGGWGTVWAKAAFDEDRVPHGITGASLGDSGWAAGIGAQFNIPNMPGSSLRLAGYYNDSDNDYGVSSPLGVDAEWTILASYNQQFSETLGASVAFEYFNDLYSGTGSDISTGVDAYAAELSVIWFPVSQFEVRSELGYTKAENLDGSVSGWLRFTRYF
ncbi:porin [Mesorhizobium australicum]|uniref:Porin n=1 Tax=Mesorhizobium australicum TaxID=536018 RepID=A0A1X7P067_9HYPH|nr:porin [Mesorhizobium australicum]SMH43503.1 Porin subfamily protein [Mesorhizobium australicum]